VSERTEVVYVIDRLALIDSESYQRQLSGSLCGRLHPGYYVVRRRDGAPAIPYDANAEFNGPFATREDAERAAEARSPACGAEAGWRPD